ncbi:hypothetical protein CHCC20335_3863 [Bacillus paralicheniformis]|nr:hypothetical protein CHCC20335_3863 [Bacillus paralicheniformis]
MDILDKAYDFFADDLQISYHHHSVWATEKSINISLFFI